MTLIETKTAGVGGVASFDFTGLGSYSSTYTDLYLVCSIRATQYTADNLFIQLNNSSSNFTFRNIYHTGSGTPSVTSGSTNEVGAVNGSGSTASVFSNCTIHIPDYSSSNYKTISFDGTIENAGTRGDGALYSSLWSNVSAITSVKILPSTGTFVEGSTISLYGISKVTSTPKATGGIISQDATYWYHTFPFTSTFTPTTALTADILCIAGGGGGGNYYGSGGGGAGGLLGFTSQSLTTTGYTVTVGAGGPNAPTGSFARGTQGGNSQFGALTASVGGGGGGSYGGAGAAQLNGGSGGSGGGGGNSDLPAATGIGGSGTSGQGYAGGNGWTNNAAGANGGGGGGAGAVGVTATSAGAGNGGAGVSTYSSWGLATFTGQIVGGTAYYAGGGGGSVYISGTPSVGGIGGGGNGGNDNGSTKFSPTAGLTNTGSGGGGYGQQSNIPLSGNGNGGSGLVIVRYAK